MGEWCLLGAGGSRWGIGFNRKILKNLKMKKLIILALVQISTFELSAQLHWTHEWNDGGCQAFLKTSWGAYAMLHEENNYFMGVSPDGNLIFDSEGEPQPGFNTFISFIDLFEMAGNTYGAIADVADFDPTSGWANGYRAVLQFDITGQIISSADTYFFSGDKGVGLSNGDMVLINYGSHNVTRVTNAGMEVWEKNLNISPSDLALTQSDTLLFLTPNGLWVMDEHGTTVSIHPAINHKLLKADPLAGIVCVAGDSLFLYNHTYDLISKKGLAGDNIKDFDVRDGKIAVLTHADSVHVFDSTLVSVGSFGLSEDAEFRFLSVSSQTVTLAGLEAYGGSPVHLYGTASTFLKEYTFEGNNFNQDNDTGVIGITPSPGISVQETSPTSYWINMQDVAVTVRNFGDKTVSSLKLQATYNNPHYFENLNLEAGQELTINVPELRLFHNGSQPAGQVLDLCIWTSHPDQRVDSDNSNDLFCTDFLVGSKEAILSEGMVLFPNPASRLLNVQLLEKPSLPQGSIRVSDITGRIVLNTSMINTDKIAIPVQDWPVGMYFLQYLVDGEILAMERFVVVQ
jgi:hypothetical protein